MILDICIDGYKYIYLYISDSKFILIKDIFNRVKSY